MNYRIIKLAIALLPAAITSCDDDGELTINTTLITSMGNEISMDGIWVSECVDFTEFRLKESFDFNASSLVIDINQFADGTCTDVINNEIITIEFQVLGTIDATLNGITVMGNKISGTETSSTNNISESFKQTFYVDDSVDPILLYHGIFGDDGGATSPDGYPIELHPFAIAKQ